MKRTLLNFTLALVAMFFASCSNDDDNLPKSKHLDFAVLRTVFAPIDKEDPLLPLRNRTMIINSVEDVRSTQTKRFIQENPNWLNVDFETKSIIAYRSVTAYGDRWVASRVNSFSLCLRSYHVFHPGDYILIARNSFNKNLAAAETNDSTHLTFQIAIVCDKIPSDANVWVVYDETYE